LPFNNKQKFRVRINVADHSITCPEARIVKTGYNRWAYRFDMSEFLSPFEKVEDIADVFIYLIDQKDDIISYFREKAANFIDVDPKLKWYHMTLNKPLEKCKRKEQAGFIQFKLSIRAVGEAGLER
jgi:hypothetical protein